MEIAEENHSKKKSSQKTKDKRRRATDADTLTPSISSPTVVSSIVRKASDSGRNVDCSEIDDPIIPTQADKLEHEKGKNSNPETNNAIIWVSLDEVKPSISCEIIQLPNPSEIATKAESTDSAVFLESVQNASLLFKSKSDIGPINDGGGGSEGEVEEIHGIRQIVDEVKVKYSTHSKVDTDQVMDQGVVTGVELEQTTIPVHDDEPATRRMPPEIDKMSSDTGTGVVEGHSTIAKNVNSMCSEVTAMIPQSSHTPHVPADPPWAQARRRLLSEPELQEFLTVPPFDTRFKSCYRPMTSSFHRRNVQNNGGHHEKVPLDVSWKELSEELGFECLDTSKDEAIAFYTMILWDDLLPPLPTKNVDLQKTTSSSAPASSQQPPKPTHVMSDCFGETALLDSSLMTRLPEYGPSVTVDGHHHRHHDQYHHHHLGCPSSSMAHAHGPGCSYHSCNPYVYGHNHGSMYQVHQQQSIRNNSFYDQQSIHRHQHYQKLTHCGFNMTNHHHHQHQQVHSKNQTPKFTRKKSSGSQLAPAAPPAPPLWLGGVGVKTKRILARATSAVRAAFRGTKNKTESGGEKKENSGPAAPSQIDAVVDDQKSSRRREEEAAVVNSTEELLLAEALLLSEEEEKAKNFSTIQHLNNDHPTPQQQQQQQQQQPTTSTSEKTVDPPKFRGIFSLKRKNKKPDQV